MSTSIERIRAALTSAQEQRFYGVELRCDELAALLDVVEAADKVTDLWLELAPVLARHGIHDAVFSEAITELATDLDLFPQELTE